MEGTKLDLASVRRAVEEAVLEVLETMCFEFPVAEPEDGGEAGGEAVEAAARFEGTLRGELRVALTGGAPQRLAAAFLGLEEHEVGAKEELLMASELANMICGAALSRLEPHGRLRIVPPQAGRGPARCEGRCWLRFPLELGEVAVTLRCEEIS